MGYHRKTFEVTKVTSAIHRTPSSNKFTAYLNLIIAMVPVTLIQALEIRPNNIANIVLACPMQQLH